MREFVATSLVFMFNLFFQQKRKIARSFPPPLFFTEILVKNSHAMEIRVKSKVF